MSANVFSRLSFCVACVWLLSACGGNTLTEQKVVIHGALKGLDKKVFGSDTVQLFLSTLGPLPSGIHPDSVPRRPSNVVDTIQAVRGQFRFEKTFYQPVYAHLAASLPSGRVVLVTDLFLSAGDYEIKDKDTVENTFDVESTAEENKTYTAYKKLVQPVHERFEQIRKAFSENQFRAFQLKQAGKSVPQSLQDEFTTLRDSAFVLVQEKTKADSVFIVEHPRSVVSAWLLFSNLLYDALDNQQYDALYKACSDKIRSSVYLQHAQAEYKRRKQNEEKVGPGKPAPEIAQPTPDGTIFKLSSLRGQVVVLDFWASWCAPCRASNPTLVQLYNTYKTKGVAFLSVSLDESKAEWVKAIRKDNLPWTQVSDLKGWENADRAAYGVESIPATFLIDREGTIIKKVEIVDLARELDAAVQNK